MDPLYFNLEKIADLGIRFVLNLGVVLILVRWIYWRVRQEREFAFSFTLTNILIFLLCYMMHGTEISMGFAFGLFAVFGILRYRTTTLPVKEMTYLFASISVALLNGISTDTFSLLELVFTNALILIVVYLLEILWKEEGATESSKKVEYERIDLIEKGDDQIIVEDLKTRTGLDVTRFEVKNMNLLTKSAMLKVFYEAEEENEQS